MLKVTHANIIDHYSHCVGHTYLWYSQTHTDALQQLQPSVNGARKLVANIFEGRPIQDETKNTPPDSTPSAPSSVELPFVKEKPKRKVRQ